VSANGDALDKITSGACSPTAASNDALEMNLMATRRFAEEVVYSNKKYSTWYDLDGIGQSSPCD
jgi:hypothetical protein